MIIYKKVLIYNYILRENKEGIFRKVYGFLFVLWIVLFYKISKVIVWEFYVYFFEFCILGFE